MKDSKLEIDLPQGLPAGEVEVTIKARAAQVPKQSLLGLLSDMGNAPSADVIDEARAEMWKHFPREDVW